MGFTDDRVLVGFRVMENAKPPPDDRSNSADWAAVDRAAARSRPMAIPPARTQCR